MRWRLLLILLATVIAFSTVFNVLQKLRLTRSVIEDIGSGHSDAFTEEIDKYIAYYDNSAEGYYPYHWQAKQREQLRKLLDHAETPPTGSDELTLAQYAEYAIEHANHVDVLREGMHRDPQNALYHYLLADQLLKQAISGEWPKKTTGEFRYPYIVKDRHMLDEGMREVARGLSLPYRRREDTLWRTRLGALPEAHDLFDYVNETALASQHFNPEYPILRNIERVNGYYLSLLLAEGKRNEAEPFLRTGERLVIQLSHDNPPTLIKAFVVQAIGKTAKKYDVQACRKYGLTREANLLEAHYAALLKYETHYCDSIKSDKQIREQFRDQYSGLLVGLLLPVIGGTPGQYPLTVEALKPSRMIEYQEIEKALASVVMLLFFLFMLANGIKYLRWRSIIRAAETPAEAIFELTSTDWMRLIIVGLVLPLAIYLCFFTSNIQGYGMRTAINSFMISQLLILCWVLIVPPIIAASRLWKHAVDDEWMTSDQYWGSLLYRLGGSLCTVIWVAMSSVTFILPLTLVAMAAVSRTPFNTVIQLPLPLAVLVALVTLAIPFIPWFWERRYPKHAAVHLTIARNMTTVFAVMALLVALLIPTCSLLVRRNLRADTIMGIARQGEAVGVMKIEGYVALKLRNDILAKAKSLHIPRE